MLLPSMLRQSSSIWRLARRAAEEIGKSLNNSSSETVSQGSKQSWTVERPYSSSRPSSLKEEAVNSRLFERAKAAPLPVEDVEADVKKLAEPFTRATVPSNAEILGKSLTPLRHLPKSAAFSKYLRKFGKIRIPISRSAFNKVQSGPYAKHFVESADGLSFCSAFLEYDEWSETMGEGRTTYMMTTLIPMISKQILQALPQIHGCNVLLDWEGNKSQKLATYPSSAVVAGKRPDILLFVEGATALIGEHKGGGDLAIAMERIVGHLQGGFHAYRFGNVAYLPVYAAAGSLLRFGSAVADGTIEWYHPTLQLGLVDNRASALLAVVQLTRWWALMSRLLPLTSYRLKLLSPIVRDNGVTILLKGKRVHKEIQSLSAFLDASPGGSFKLLKTAYSKAKRNKYLVNANARPECSRSGRYLVELEAYGLPANPKTRETVWALLRACCSAAAHLHANGIAHRDIRRHNVLNRHDKEGDYVLIDLELAGPLGNPWPKEVPHLADWDANTLHKTGVYDAHSDLHQIGVMVKKLPAWPELRNHVLDAFVDKLLAKEFQSASDAVGTIPK